MDLALFVQWRLRLALLDTEMFQEESSVELRILLYIYLNKGLIDRKTLLDQFNLDRITMRTRIRTLINRKLIKVEESEIDRRQKNYLILQGGVKLLRDYRDEVIKKTFLFT